MSSLPIFIAVALFFFLLSVVLFFSNRKLKQEIKVLHEVLSVKDTTISNLEASRVAVKDVIENISAHDEVMALIDAGESRSEVAEKLGIPLNRIELIIKFDKLKKEKQA